MKQILISGDIRAGKNTRYKMIQTKIKNESLEELRQKRFELFDKMQEKIFQNQKEKCEILSDYMKTVKIIDTKINAKLRENK